MIYMNYNRAKRSRKLRRVQFWRIKIVNREFKRVWAPRRSTKKCMVENMIQNCCASKMTLTISLESETLRKSTLQTRQKPGATQVARALQHSSN